jgi:hypothetical protein
MLPGTKWAVFLWLPAIKHTHDVISVKFVSREIWPSHDKPTPIPHDILTTAAAAVHLLHGNGSFRCSPSRSRMKDG